MMNREPILTQYVFQVEGVAAQHVSLVIGPVNQLADILPVRPCGEGIWRTTLHLVPGTYRYCYYAYDGRTLMAIAPPDAPVDGIEALMYVEPTNTKSCRPTLWAIGSRLLN